MNIDYAATMSDKKEIAELKAENERLKKQVKMYADMWHEQLARANKLELEMKRLDKMRVADYRLLEQKYSKLVK